MVEEKHKKYTLIMGATSEIGEEFIKSNIEKKYILIEHPREKTKLESLITNYKVNAISYYIDIRSVSKIEDIFKIINGRKFEIDAFLYLIGINHLIQALDITEEIWDEIMDTNIKGCFFATREIAKNMIMNKIEGRIINISSQHGIIGNIQRVAYCSSKAALINMTKALAIEWADYGIRINSIAPTFIINDKNRDFLMNGLSRRKYLNNIPLKEYCTSEEIARLITYLISPENKMITGQTVVVDGGWTIK